MKTDRPREFWIVDHDLGDGKMLAKGTVMGSSIRPSEETISRFPDKLIHMIKYSAYETLLKKHEIALMALGRIVGMVETWTDEHGQRNIEEIEASRIAREALKNIEVEK